MGYFYINLINDDSHMETQDYIDAMFEHSFIPVTNKPIRIITTTATIIYTTDSNYVLGTIINRMELCIHVFRTTYQYFYLLNEINDTKVDIVIDIKI